MRQNKGNKDELKELRDFIGYESIVFEQSKNQKNYNKENSIRIRPVKAEVNEVEAFNELKRKKEAKILNWAVQEEQ